jgi:ubiquinone/menaquinone biosynthesis C-methylase UbiE
MPISRNNQNSREAYNQWAGIYDTNHNKTRDLEAAVLRTVLENIPFRNCLEIGSGTGKNTAWLLKKSSTLTAVDFSIKMLEKAKQKIQDPAVRFVCADITKTWNFSNPETDLIVFSLVLEHIKNLGPVFRSANKALVTGGCIYISELHPFKQYLGSKARFETANGNRSPDCFVHHLTDYIQAAKKQNLTLTNIQEFFDDQDHSGPPRILHLLFKKI